MRGDSNAKREMNVERAQLAETERLRWSQKFAFVEKCLEHGMTLEQADTVIQAVDDIVYGKDRRSHFEIATRRAGAEKFLSWHSLQSFEGGAWDGEGSRS